MYSKAVSDILFHMTLSEELQWRGFVNQTTYKSIDAVDGDPITFYWGVDPSAPSMTIGNLATAMMVRHFIEHGHKAVLLVGGATGMIGDPDGKGKERDLKPLEEIQANKKGIEQQYKSIFDGQEFVLVDNYDWFKDISYLEFLRDTGKNVPMRQMLGRDFVQKRLSEDGPGISYAEFSYVLIQAYDFLHMNRKMGVTLQVCGSDQWGNSIAGVDLIRRVAGKEAHVWSAPLVVDKATGTKFGKSETGAIWLDEKMTAPNDFYQFWVNLGDEAVEDYLKIYTLLTKEEINQVMAEFNQNRAGRLAQKRLAREVTKLVHGEEAANTAEAHAATLSVSPSPSAAPDMEAGIGSSIADALVESELASSKTEARQLLSSGGVYINDQQTTKEKFENSDFVDGLLKLRRGKSLHNTVIIKLK